MVFRAGPPTKLVIALGVSGLALTAPVQAQSGTPLADQAGSPSPTAPKSPAATDIPAQTTLDAASDVGLGEIVVTAQKRSENLQKVPIAVTVATASEMRASGVGDIQTLKIVAPGLEVQGNHGYAYPILRGVGSKANLPGVEAPISVYIDGVYYAAATANLLTFNNIAQVEVLKGPQGTLFGRNATGGLIQVTTKDPKQQFGGEFDVSYSNYQTVKGTGYLTGGLAENIAVDLAFSGVTMGTGYGKNFFNNHDTYKIDRDVSVRSKLLFTPTSRTTARLILDYGTLRNNMDATRVRVGEAIPAPYGPTYGGGPYDVSTDTDNFVDVKQGGVSLRVDQDLGALKLASITAYRATDYTAQFDFDYTATRGRINNYAQRDRQFSQEVQLLSGSTGRFVWSTGAYYFWASSGYPYETVSFLGPAMLATKPPTYLSNTVSNQGTDSIAGFAQATLEILPGFRATGGLRYTSEKRTLNDSSTTLTRTDGSTVVSVPVTNKSARFKKLTFRAALDYQFTPDILGYVSFNRGFKSGGFNTNSLTLPAFKPEVLDAYEVGLKSTLFDRRLRFNVGGFHYDYSNVQVSRVVNGSSGISNGAKATVYGAEAELEARIMSALNVKIGYQYLHGRYDSFPNAIVSTRMPSGIYSINNNGSASGNQTIFSPHSTLSASLNYTIPVGQDTLDLNASYYYNSGYYQEVDNTIHQPAYSQVNLSARYRLNNGVSLSIWGNNLTNVAVPIVDGIQSFGAVGVRRTAFAAPRTYGATLGYAF